MPIGDGAVLGCVIGLLFSNSMISLLFSGMGIYNANFSVNAPAVILICIGMVITAYVVSMLVSHRIKGITAYSLIT